MPTIKNANQKSSAKPSRKMSPLLIGGVIAGILLLVFVGGLWYVFSYDPNANLVTISPTKHQFLITSKTSTFAINDKRGPNFTVSIVPSTEYLLTDTVSPSSYINYPKRKPQRGRFLILTTTITNHGSSSVTLQVRDAGSESDSDGIIGPNGTLYHEIGGYDKPNGPSSPPGGVLTIPDDFIDCTRTCTFAFAYDVPKADQNYTANLAYYTAQIGEEVQHKGYAMDIFIDPSIP